MANGLCEAIAPRVFRVGDDDVAEVLQPEPAGDDRAAADRAGRLCPTRAITVTD